MKVYYEKRKGKYVRVALDRRDVLNGLRPGLYFVVIGTGSLGMARIEAHADYDALWVATQAFQPRLSEIIQKASKMRPCTTPLTPQQRKAWDDLEKALGSEMFWLNSPACQDIATDTLNELARLAREKGGKNHE